MKTPIAYSHVNFPLQFCQKNNLTEYINSNLNKTIFEYNGNLYDIKSLNRLVNLDCLNCHHAHTKLCCDGSPYPPLEEDKEKIHSNFELIMSQTMCEKDYIMIRNYIEENGLYNEYGSFNEYCGKCIFSVKINETGAYGCAIHSYAEKNNLDHTLIKPKGCMMYPLDVISFSDGSEFIFGTDEGTVTAITPLNDGSGYVTINDDNKGFSRWSQFDLEFICVNINYRKSIINSRQAPCDVSKGNLPDSMFLLEGYRPIYEEEKKVIITLYGIEAYEFVKRKSIELADSGVVQHLY